MCWMRLAAVMCSSKTASAQYVVSCHLERHSVLELVQEHLELPNTDDKVRKAELILHIPPERPKLQSLLHIATCSFVSHVMVRVDTLLDPDIKLLTPRDVCATNNSRCSTVTYSALVQPY